MAALAIVPIPTTPALFNDPTYRDIREEFNTTLTALKKRLQGVITTPHFFKWVDMHKAYTANEDLIKPFSQRVIVWNPTHEEGRIVQKLFLEFVELFAHPEVDAHESAMGKVMKLMMFVGQHNAEQEERDKLLQEEREKMSAFGVHTFTDVHSAPSAASSPAVSAAPLPQVDDSLFTDIPPAEEVQFQRLQLLIPVSWMNKDADLSTLSSPTHSSFTLSLHPSSSR